MTEPTHIEGEGEKGIVRGGVMLLHGTEKDRDTPMDFVTDRHSLFFVRDRHPLFHVPPGT